MALFNPSWINIASQFGMPLFGVAGLPAFTGNYFWVDQTNGSDGNTGGPQDPFKTLSQAHSVCTNNNNDVVFLTGTVHVTATVTWSKSRTHLIGLAPKLDSQARARISQTGSTLFTPLVTVSGSECIFMNIGSLHGFDDASAQVCWNNTGGRNQYINCLFGGMGNATAAAQAGGRSLVITGTTGENTFTNCQLGLDTITRSAANATLELAGGTPRNVFRKCIFPFLTSAATPLGIIASAAAAADRWHLFEECSFINCVQSTSTTMSGLSTLAASMGGLLLMQRSTMVGITEWGTDATSRGQIYVDGAPPTAATSGIAVNPT